VLSRQNLPVLDRQDCHPASGVQQGGYILWESAPSPEIIFIATGSEVPLTISAGRALAAEGVRVRVVSLPSWETTARIAVEAGIRLGWEHYVGLTGKIIGMSGFGASAPGPILYERFGLTSDRIIGAARELLSQK